MPTLQKREKTVTIRGRKFRIIGFGKLCNLGVEKGGRGGGQPVWRLEVYNRNGRWRYNDWFSQHTQVAFLEPARTK